MGIFPGITTGCKKAPKPGQLADILRQYIFHLNESIVVNINI